MKPKPIEFCHSDRQPTVVGEESDGRSLLSESFLAHGRGLRSNDEY